MIYSSIKDKDTSTYSTDIWDIQSGRMIASWSGSYVASSISLDEKYGVFLLNKISGSVIYGRYLVVYDFQQEREIFRINNNELGEAINISQDGKQLIYIDLQKRNPDTMLVNMLDFETLNQTSSFSIIGEEDSLPKSITLSPDDQIIAIGYSDGKIRLFDSDGNEKRSWIAHECGGRCTALDILFTADSTKMASLVITRNNYFNPTIKLWGIWP